MTALPADFNEVSAAASALLRWVAALITPQGILAVVLALLTLGALVAMLVLLLCKKRRAGFICLGGAVVCAAAAIVLLLTLPGTAPVLPTIPTETEGPTETVPPPAQTEAPEETPQPTPEIYVTPSDLFVPPAREDIPEPTPLPEELGPGIKTYTAYNTGSRFAEGDLVVAADTGYIFPYVLFEWGSIGKGGLYRVDTVFRFTLTDGTEENWLLLSTADGSDIGEYSLYTKLGQLWLRESDAVAYDTDEGRELLRWPVWVAEGTRDVNGFLIDSSMRYSIAREYEDPTLGDLVELSMLGGESYWVSRRALVYPEF